MENITLILTTITVGLTEIVKQAEVIPAKFIPLIALIIGSALAYQQGLSIVDGIIIGLSASGLYSSVKNMAS